MAAKLTETAASRAQVRAGKTQAFLWDAAVTGFGLRVLPAGSRTFWFQYRAAGKSRMVKIGTYPTTSVADARKAARVFAGEVARGLDPAAKRQAQRAHSATTLRTLLAEGGPYQHHLTHRRIVNGKMILSGLNRGLRHLMSRDVAIITRQDFVAAIDDIVADGRPGAAQDLRKFARTFLEWCVSTGRIIANPLAGLRNPKRSRAERLAAAANGGRALNDDELRRVWQAAGRFGSFGGLVRLALLTGLRRGELAQIERARDLLADRIVVQPEHAKTGVLHEVPLTDLMRQVIAGEPVTTNKLLFPSAVTGGRIKGWTNLITKIQHASGVSFRLHDLRRTARTLMSRLGVAEDIAELAIGHVRVDLIARYNKDQAWEGRCDAFARVNTHVESLIGGREGGAIIPLRG
jgi:integrase